MGSTVRRAGLVLGAVIEGSPRLLALVTPDVVQRGISAGSLISEITPAIGGKGGGRPNMAQGGGTDASGLDNALGMVPTAVARALGLENGS